MQFCFLGHWYIYIYIYVYIYHFYSGNTKLDMPFWFKFDISIPMLARYNGLRRIDMDPVQFCNLRDISNYGKIFEFE